MYPRTIARARLFRKRTPRETPTPRVAQSLVEQFGFRWSDAADRYIRTWLDFIVRGPGRFVARLEADRNRYTPPTVFFIDSIVLASFGIWAWVALNKAEGETWRNAVTTQIAWSFGHTIFQIFMAIVAMWIVRPRGQKRVRRPWVRLRRLYTAFAYSSSVLLLLPFSDAGAEMAMRWGDSTGETVTLRNVAAVAFSVLHLFYLFTAIAATHHLPVRRVAIGALLVSSPFIAGVLLLSPWESWVEPNVPEIHRYGDVNPSSAGRNAPFLVSVQTRSPQAPAWSERAWVMPDTEFVHFRILTAIGSGPVKDLRLRFNRLAEENDRTAFMATASSDFGRESHWYTEVDGLRGQRLVWHDTTVFFCSQDKKWPLPNAQLGHEILLPDGLALGDWNLKACGYTVVTFRVEPLYPG